MSIQWTTVDEAGAALLADFGLTNYIDFIERQPGQEVGKSSTTRTTRVSVGRAVKTDVFFVKTYRYAGTQWRHRLRRDKASLEASNYELLDEIGIGTASVVAYGSRRSALRLKDAVIVTRGLPDVISLDRLFELRWPHAGKHAADSLRSEILDRVVQDVRRMHGAAFFHVDLQWRNILIGGLGEGPSVIRRQPSAEMGRIRIYFLDAPRGGIRRSLWGIEHGRLRDLSCLYKEARRRLSRTEQLRWLLIYLGEPRVTPTARSMIATLILDRSVKDNE